jgi:hypothetical protein
LLCLRLTNRALPLATLVHCIPPLSRSAHVAGLVTSRQTFVRRCHGGPAASESKVRQKEGLASGA